MSSLSDVLISVGWNIDFAAPFVQLDYDVTKTSESGDGRARSVGWSVSDSGLLPNQVYSTQIWDLDYQTVDTTEHRSYEAFVYFTSFPSTANLDPGAYYVIDVWMRDNTGAVLDSYRFYATMLLGPEYNSYELHYWRVDEASYSEVLNAPASHGSISDNVDSSYLEISDSGSSTAIGSSRGPTVVAYDMEPLPVTTPWYMGSFVRAKYDPALTPIVSFGIGGEGVVFLGHDSDWTPPSTLASFMQTWLPQDAMPGLESLPQTCLQLFDGNRLATAGTSFTRTQSLVAGPIQLSDSAWKAHFVHATSDGSFVGPGVFVISDFYVLLAKYSGTSGGPGPDTPTYTGEPPGTEPTGPVEPDPVDPVPLDAELIPGLAQMRAGLTLRPLPTLIDSAELIAPDSILWELPVSTKSDPGVGTAAVDGVFIARGLPYEDTWRGVEANPVEYFVEVTEEAASTYPNPDDVALGSTVRWLPLGGSYISDSWDPFAGSGMTLHGSGYGGVTLDTDLDYMRGKNVHAGGGIILEAEDYLYTDDVDFSDTDVTVAMVVVPRRPPAAFTGLLTTGPDTEVYDKTQPYIDLRYYADGRVITQYNTRLGSVTTATGVVRAGQPIVVGFSYQRYIKTLVTFTMDRKAVYTPHTLDQNHPTAARLFVGNSLAAAADESFADMDILEVNFWNARMFTKHATPAKRPRGWQRYTYEGLGRALTRLNRIYGVTVS